MNKAQNSLTYDVIISGAGPVGLFLACELALAKCSVLILEQAESPSSPLKKLPFGIRGLSAPSIEMLDRRGLLQELEIHKRVKNPHQNAKQGAERQAGHFAGIPFGAGNIDVSQWKYRLPSSTATSLISEMEELETVLSLRSEALGIALQRGVKVTGFQQTGANVVVQSEGQSFQSKWLIGCDGSRSAVRKEGGFEFVGTEPEFTGYTTQVDLVDPEKLGTGRVVTSNGMYLQSQPGYLVIQDFDGGAFHDSKEPITLEHVQSVLRRISGTDVSVSALHLATSWTDRARQVTAYRNGRVLLAGDAAHIHAPLGGQGLNLGLGDAMNLGWKLASTIKQEAPDGLLDTYYIERHPIGEKVLDWSRAQVAIMRPDADARALHAIVRELMDTRDGATYFAGKVWGVNTIYDLGSEHPLVGRSVPNFELEEGITVGQLMSDGLGLLLDFKNNASLKTLIGKGSSQLKYVSGTAKEQFEVSAVLVRPDGVVAWASNEEINIPTLCNAIERWFVADSTSP